MSWPILDLTNNLISAPQVDLEEIHLKAYKDATYQFLKQVYLREHVAQFMEDGSLPSLPNDDRMVELLEKARDRTITKPPYILLTVNAQPGISFEKFRTKVEKYVTRSIIDAYLYVYEVRATDGGGLHCHALLKYNCKPYDFKRNAKSTFKNVCAVNNPSVLNIRYVENDKVESKINYLLGHKCDKKRKSMEIIKAWREANNISAYFESNPRLPCRVAESGHRRVTLVSPQPPVPGHTCPDAGQVEVGETKDARD